MSPYWVRDFLVLACPVASADLVVDSLVGVNRQPQNNQKGFISDYLAGTEQEEGNIALLFIINNLLTFVV
jgi:hypothetical protein